MNEFNFDQEIENIFRPKLDEYQKFNINLRKLIKQNFIVKNIAYSIYRSLQKLGHILLRSNHSRLLDGELNLFRQIVPYCKTIVDVGARTDTDYIKLSIGNGISYYLFEANPSYFNSLCAKVNRFAKEIIFVENFAIGESNGLVNYYTDSQSVLINTTAVKQSTASLGFKIKMTRLDTYFQKTKNFYIDFLKTDIEEYDFFALVGAGELLNRCKFIQFELGIGAPLQHACRFVNNQDYYTLLDPNFHLYIVRDENNPLWKECIFKSDLIVLNSFTKKVIEIAQATGVGFNLFAFNKSNTFSLDHLIVDDLPQDSFKAYFAS